MFNFEEKQLIEIFRERFCIDEDLATDEVVLREFSKTYVGQMIKPRLAWKGFLKCIFQSLFRL